MVGTSCSSSFEICGIRRWQAASLTQDLRVTGRGARLCPTREGLNLGICLHYSLSLSSTGYRKPSSLGRGAEGGGAGEGKSSSGICATRRMLLLETQGEVSHELCLRRRRGRLAGEQARPTRDLSLRLSNGTE